MSRSTLSFCVVLLALLCPSLSAQQNAGAGSELVDDKIKVAAGDWPWWRGPLRNGTAQADPKIPTKWSATENVVWKKPVPGRGQSSPILSGAHLYLTTSDEKTGSQSVLCYDRKTGESIWAVEVHKSGAMRKNDKASAAGASVATDGERVYVNFANSGAVYTTALARDDGKQLWQTNLGDYAIHQGYASSPALYQSLVIVSADSKGDGSVAGLDRKSGQIVWKQSRPKVPNYSSPVLLRIEGRDQAILTGCDLVSSYDPLTGKVLWETAGATTECVTSTVTDGKHVFTSGGYPKNHLSAVVADGSGKLAWETKDRVYVPSFVIRDGYLYGVLDAGVAACWKSDTGKEGWKQRLGGTFSASTVLVGDKVYATNEAGETFIFAADPAKFTEVAKNKLGNEAFATPTIAGGRIYHRVADQVEGKRQEMLYCLGE
jgi:outer membrane protein assembly factor BamB